MPLAKAPHRVSKETIMEKMSQVRRILRAYNRGSAIDRRESDGVDAMSVVDGDGKFAGSIEVRWDDRVDKMSVWLDLNAEGESRSRYHVRERSAIAGDLIGLKWRIEALK